MADTAANNGSFNGLDKIGRAADGRLNLKILVVHGIGWNQSSSNLPVGHDLVASLSRKYQVSGDPFDSSTHLCPQSERRGKVARDAMAGGLRLHTAGKSSFRSDDAQTPFNIWSVGCLDKTTIRSGDGSITIYRLLWDDTFYDAFDYVLVGYDDQLQTGHEEPQLKYGGYEDLAALRRPGTRRIRDQVLTYGMTDAALYMGPVGKLMRSAVYGAICTVINDASGSGGDFGRLDESGRTSPYQDVQVDKACRVPTGSTSFSLAIVAESLGSRIVFDTLSRERDDALTAKMDSLAAKDLEVYLIANQLPLIAASRLVDVSSAESKSPPPLARSSIKYIAFTEVDDLLSYELVPYFEHLAYLRCRLADEKTKLLQNPNCGAEDPTAMVRKLKGSQTERLNLVRQLGFDAVDVRVKFAPRLIPITNDYADYQEAHTGYLRNKQVVDALVCGVTDGRVNASQAPPCRK